MCVSDHSGWFGHRLRDDFVSAKTGTKAGSVTVDDATGFAAFTVKDGQTYALFLKRGAWLCVYVITRVIY